MNWDGVVLWGFAATVVLTTILYASQGLGFTRMSIPYLLGTMLVADRDRARLAGFALHFFNGWAFACVYAAAFEWWGEAGWLRGAAIGAVHAGFVLTAGMRALPSLHPRMASEEQGPSPLRVLEPPGFLALHYGVGTPAIAVLAHLVYGAILGSFYRP